MIKQMLFLILFVQPCTAQFNQQLESSSIYPNLVLVNAPVPVPVKPHFWTKRQIAVSLGFAGENAYDGWSTQYLKQQQGFRELDPLARPFVNQGTVGQVEICVIGWSAITGSQWLAHHRGHRRFSNVIGTVALAVEGANITRQYGLVRSVENTPTTPIPVCSSHQLCQTK